MLKRLSIILIGTAVLLSACGPQGTPTMAPVDIQNTAVAAAFTMVAETQAAIPTNTLPPPTETPTLTPEPTFTLPPTATLDQQFVLPTATQAVASDPNSCVKALNIAEAGPLKRVRLENNTTASINISLNLYVKNAHGQCGAVSYSLKKNEKKYIEIPVGLWYAYAWLTYPNGKTGTASGSFEINIGYDDLVSVVIKEEIVIAH